MAHAPTLPHQSARTLSSTTAKSRTWKGLCLAALAGLGVGMSDSAAQAAPDGLMLVSDFGLPAIRIFDPGTNKIVWDYNFEAQKNENCSSDKVFCSNIGGAYAKVGSEDFVDTAMTVFDRRITAGRYEKMYSVVQRIKVGPTPGIVWKAKYLDFKDVPDASAYCVQTEPTTVTDYGCLPRLVHSIQVLKDDSANKTVTFVMAEMYNHRISQVTLNYANNNTVGHVDWVLGDANPEWPSAANPNGLQYLTNIPGGPYLVTTFYSATGEQSSGGLVMMWRQVNGEWQEVWQHPQNLTSAVELLNTPHLGKIIFDPKTQEPYFVYSHSRGTATAWGTYDGYGGSYGVGDLGGSITNQPVYQMDAITYADDPNRQTHFSRDIDWLDDGTLLLSDAACESGTCPWPSRIFRVEPFFLQDTLTSRAGYYAPDRSAINMVDIPQEAIIEEYQCGLKCLYESEFIPAGKLGTSLTSLRGTATTLCPAPQ